jgi:hypothetical protein
MIVVKNAEAVDLTEAEGLAYARAAAKVRLMQLAWERWAALTPDELESLRRDAKEASAWLRAHWAHLRERRAGR